MKFEFLKKPVLDDNGFAEALLNMDTDQGAINIYVTTEVDEDMNDPDLRKNLFYDGVRQLGRMPGYRCGTNQVVLIDQAVVDII